MCMSERTQADVKLIALFVRAKGIEIREIK